MINCQLMSMQQNGPNRAKALINKSNLVPATPVEKGKANLYAMEVDEDGEEVRTTKCTILIKDNKINILINSGCIHSFIPS